MEANNETFSRSLPPLVEGKIHGYLRLVIDEIVWTRRSPGNIAVLASWWGELDSAQFRPADIKSGETRLEADITETYAIRTNIELFEEYLKNCETVELVVISEKTHQVLGTAQVSDLENLLNGKPYFQYVVVSNDSGSRIGDIHVTMKLLNILKSQKSPSKTDAKKKQLENKLSMENLKILQNYSKPKSLPEKNIYLYENDVPAALKNAKQSENIYRSILKESKNDSINSLSLVNDKLVAQVVARAQRLRGAILRESRDDDPLALSDGSTNSIYRPDENAKNEATLYEYFLGKKMTSYEEKKALKALRSTSPTPSLIDLAAETIRTCRSDKNPSIILEKMPEPRANRIIDNFSVAESTSTREKIISPIDYVDSLRIVVESLTLTSAGYRKVQSFRLSRGDGIPASVTYFVQYDAIFGGFKKLNRKLNDNKPVKICSNREIGQTIYFNHDAVYELPKTYLQMNMPLKFKIFHRHLNQRTPTELGIGSMYVSDATRLNSLSSTQRLAIVSKRIKIGELKVTAELGCDKIHFGKQFVEAVTSAKENIPVLEVSSASSVATEERYRTATGNGDKTGGKSSTSSGNRAESSWSGNNSSRVPRQETRHRFLGNFTEDREMEHENPSRDNDEKILLHGLIYVAEGKDLISTNTYLICRAFWREDKASSRYCHDTNNPFYNFHQLVPIIHGPDLLERTKDNFIVVEIYSRNSNGVDSLLGISKLSIHQLYVAYRDPQVLSHLLRSKYPVISVDGWINVNDPVTGSTCGQLLGLVALGTADQIAHLEATRGLRDSSVANRAIRNLSFEPQNSLDLQREPRFEAQTQSETRRDNYETLQPSRTTNEGYFGLENFQSDPERSANDRNSKTQECQTEITTVDYFKKNRGDEELAGENSQSLVLNAIVDKLAQALNVPKTSADQAAQTDTNFRTNQRENTSKNCDVEPLNLGTSTNNSFSEDSDESHRVNYHLSTEIYRSVGVGAEFDDTGNPGASTSYANVDPVSTFGATRQVTDSLATHLQDSMIEEFDEISPTKISPPISNSNVVDTIVENIDDDNSSFRAVVEIECALHLPKVEKTDDSVEPCTYVSFQRASKSNATQYASYVVTNICNFSCSPKWDWRCDTRLSNDLLVNNEKRLILKVWRLIDPDTSMEINLERDIVIGFSAIDVSVLTVGFPVVSGWFHVMDFTGKCNGQIKVSITPLDSINAFGKSSAVQNPGRPLLPDFDYSNFSSPYPGDLIGENNGTDGIDSARSAIEEIVTIPSPVENETMLDIGLGLGDASMSFLSLSLKQKLTELDEIKKRLQSRLHDVTDTAFDDDLDTDFEPPIMETDQDNGNSTEDSRNIFTNNWQIPISIPGSSNSRENSTKINGNMVNYESDNNRIRSTSNSVSLDANNTDTGYSTSSQVQSIRNVSNGNRCDSVTEDNRLRLRLSGEDNSNGFEIGSVYAVGSNLSNGHYDDGKINSRTRIDPENPRSYKNVQVSNNYEGQRIADDFSSEEEPLRGTRMHISHLLDKLTTQLTSVQPPTTDQPMKRNIMDLITSLRRNNNNFPNDVKCNREVNVRTVPTQTETNYVRDSRLSQLSNNTTRETSNEGGNENDETEIPAKTQRREKVSTTIREELAADETNETNDCDELSAHLLTSNVRHMNLESILNPLLYTHLIPEIPTTDNERRNVNLSSNSTEIDAIERLDTRYTESFNATINNGLNRLRNLIDAENSPRDARNVPTTSDNEDIFRINRSAISENIDGNIDVTVIHKPCNDELMASNSIDSTTTISIEHDLHSGTEIDDNSSLNSSETSVSAVSRQAPDGGNPLEDDGANLLRKISDTSRDSSSDS